MTIIARITKGNLPLFVGDILLSSKEHPRIPVSLPTTTGDVNQYFLQRATTYVAGVVQKVNILADGLVVAWAGKEDQARILCQALQIAFQGGVEPDRLAAIIRTEQFRYRDDVSLLGSVMFEKDGDTIFHNFGYRTQRAGVPHLRVDVGGNGALEFTTLLTSLASTFSFGKGAAAGSDPERILGFGRLLVGTLMGNEHATGGGVARGWGGGFELALPMMTSERPKFEKQSIGLHVPFEVIEENGYPVLVAIYRFIKYSYEGERLVIRVLDLKADGYADLGVHLVSPLLAENPNLEITREEMYNFDHTLLQCHIREVKSGRAVQSVKFNPAGLDDVVIRRDGDGTILEIKTSLLQRLSEQASTAFGYNIRIG